MFIPNFRSCAKVILLSLGVLLLCLTYAHAQKSTLRFNHLSVAQGLLVNTVYAIHQDHEGFMWFGTKEGLDKYDGYSFTAYRHHPSDESSLSHNHVFAIFEDSRQNLWVGTEDGLNLLDRRTGTFTRFRHRPEDPSSLSGNIITAIHEDRQGILWVGTRENGLNQFDPATGRSTRFLHHPADPASLSGNRINALAEDRQGNIWVATFNGLNLFHRRQSTFSSFQPPAAEGSAPSALNPWAKVQSLFVDGEDQLWVGTYEGLGRFDQKTKTFSLHPFRDQQGLPLPDRTVVGMSDLDREHLWLATNNGIALFHKKEKTFTDYRHDINDPYSISDNALLCAFKDRKGDMWIGSYFGGVNIFHVNSNRFSHYFPTAAANSLSSKVISTILEDERGNLWIGTEGAGINYLDRRTNTYTHYKAKAVEANSLTSNNIQALLLDRAGSLWIGTYGGGLNRYSPRDQTFTQFRNSFGNNDVLTRYSDNVLSLYEDRQGNLWVGTDEGGLSLFDRERQAFTTYLGSSKDPQSLSNNTVRCIFEDQSDNLWVGTAGGLNLFDRKNRRFTRYPYDPQDSLSISNPVILCLFQDRKGNLWVGTDGGLNLLHRDLRSFTRFTVADGLPDNKIYSILEDDGGNLWLSTNKGLSRFNPATGKFRNYDAADGLQSNQFNYRSSLKSRTGELFFGGINGFNSFTPAAIQNSDFVPPVVFTDFLLFNKSVDFRDQGSPLRQQVGQTREIKLTHTQNVFGFAFSVLNFQASENNTYAYKLEGFDEDWNYVGNKRTVSFTNLSPGDYLLKVKGANNDGVWNEAGTAMKITVLPPPWRTWWAYAAYTVLFGLALYGLRQNTISKVHLQNDLKLERLTREKIEEINQAKLTFFTNISHEFRTPLTLILGPLDNLIASKPDDAGLQKQFRLMQTSANRLLGLINELMDFRKVQSGKMELQAEPTDLVQFVCEITLPFAELAESHKVGFRFESQVVAAQVWVDREKMDKVIYNLLSNAYKYTPEGGQISISLHPVPAEATGPAAEGEGEAVEIRVADTGIGIPQDKIKEIFEGYFRIKNQAVHRQQGTGIGLALTKELVKLHGGTIRVETEEGKGSCFVVRLPLHQEVEAPIVPGPEPEKELEHALHSAGILERLSLDFPEEEGQKPELNLADYTREAPLLLLVEDEEEVRQFIKENLVDRYRVIEAGNGLDGLRLAQERNPDLIISDIMMPGLMGTEVCARLKSDLRTSHIPVVLLSARSLVEQQIEGVEKGADAYITKPFHPEFLRATVQNLLDSRRRLRECFSAGNILPHSIASPDDLFLRKAIELAEANLANTEYDIEAFCKGMGVSSTLLYTKLKALTGLSANEFIRHIRLKKAAQLLLLSKLSVSEVAYEVGFNDPRYFSRCFRKEYGQAPSEYGAALEAKPG